MKPTFAALALLQLPVLLAYHHVAFSAVRGLRRLVACAYAYTALPAER